MNEPQATVVASNALLALAAEIENRFYHSQDGNGGDVRRCENFCERCFLTELIVTFIKEKANPSLQGAGHLVDRTLQGVVQIPNKEK